MSEIVEHIRRVCAEYDRTQRAMLQNLSKDIRECYLRAEECRRLAEGA